MAVRIVRNHLVCGYLCGRNFGGGNFFYKSAGIFSGTGRQETWRNCVVVMCCALWAAWQISELRKMDDMGVSGWKCAGVFTCQLKLLVGRSPGYVWKSGCRPARHIYQYDWKRQCLRRLSVHGCTHWDGVVHADEG